MKQPSQQPSNADYETLFNDFCQIYETTLLQSESLHNAQKNHAYLHMGKEIDFILSQAQQHGHYGKQLVPTLCRDTKEKYGKAPSTRTVRYMRKFANTYTESNLHAELSWSHYCILLSVDDDAQRAHLEQRIITENLQRDKLQQLVSLIQQQTQKQSSPFPLMPRKGTKRIVKVYRPQANDFPLLDVGFGVTIVSGSPTISQYPTGTTLRKQANGRLTPMQCTPGERYCYNAFLHEVVDGDTVKMRIQLTPTIFITERLRLRGVDAMELGTPEGEKAKRALTRLLKSKTAYTIYTYSTDRYGRYVADIIADDIYINKTLVEKGHARYLSMSTE